MKNLRRICFRECYEPPHEGEELPEGVEEHYDLDLWFEFEEGCLFFCHNDMRFRRVASPPAGTTAIPTTPDEMETACLPASFLGASLLGIFAERTPGFILCFDNGGIIELELEHFYLGADGPGNPYLCPGFYSAAALAAEENAACRAFLEDELAASRERNLLESPEAEPPPVPKAEPAQPNNGHQAAPLHCVSDFVNDTTPREHEALSRALWSGEYVRWATRPLLHRWNNTTLVHFGLGLLWSAWCAFVMGNMWQQRLQTPEAAAADTAFILSTLPFWCVGAWLISSPWRQPGYLRKTLYIITNKRTLVLQGGLFSMNIQSWELARNMVADREELSGDRGCLLFCDRDALHAGSDSLRHGGFMYLGNMARAEKELRRALEARHQH